MEKAKKNYGCHSGQLIEAVKTISLISFNLTPQQLNKK